MDMRSSFSSQSQAQLCFRQVIDLMVAAETEIAIYRASVFQQYGAEIACWAVQDWLSGVEHMAWPSPHFYIWQILTLQSAARLAEHLLELDPARLSACGQW